MIMTQNATVKKIKTKYIKVIIIAQFTSEGT